jgi:hypothetical protein
MTEKSITGGEVDMTELKQKMIDFVFDYEGKSLACDIVDYLASKGHLKTTGEDTDVYLTEDEWEDMVHQQECAQAEIDDLRQEIADLKAAAQAAPELPPRPQAIDNGGCKIDVYDLPRYGLSWNGPDTPVSTPMPNGYWTPFHLAVECCERAAPPIEGLEAAINNSITYPMVNDVGFQSEHDRRVVMQAARRYLALTADNAKRGDNTAADTKMGDAVKALAAIENGTLVLDVMHTYECGSRHNGGCICKAKDNEKHIETIRDALDACDKLQSGKLSIGGWETIRSALSDHLASTGRIRGEWREITEDTMPDHEEDYLLGYWKGKQWIIEIGPYTYGKPGARSMNSWATHFMPLPAAPGEKE